MPIGRLARWTMLSFTASLSAKRSIARCRLRALTCAVGLRISATTAGSPAQSATAWQTGSPRLARPAIVCCLARRAVPQKLHQVRIGQHREVGQDRQGHVVHVLGQAHRDVVRQAAGAAQALG